MIFSSRSKVEGATGLAFKETECLDGVPKSVPKGDKEDLFWSLYNDISGVCLCRAVDTETFWE